MSAATDNAMTEHQKGPIHVLMASAVSSDQQHILLDPRFQNDFVAKRAKIYRRSFNTKNSKRGLNGVWDAVSRVEKDLVSCCERIDPDSYEGDDMDVSTEGALDVEKEVHFAGILARDCHTMATKCLALAILERTMEKHLEENEEGGSDSEDGDDENINFGSEDDGQKVGSKRLRSGAENTEDRPKKQRLKDDHKVEENQDDDEDEEVEEEEESGVGRLERFLAAGGLKVLNRWLIDASTEEPVLSPMKPPSGNRKGPEKQKAKPRPPSTRPLILPMLKFLEHIPFDKKVILEAKINKQIRKLGKQVNAILKARDEATAEPHDLENWSSETMNDGEDALGQVVEAVKNVKKSWERMAKEDPRKFEDPFVSLKDMMKERLEVLVQFEGGSVPKPDWFDDSEPEKERKKASKPKKLNTKELAARERKAEKEDLKQKLQAAQNEHRERLAQLREKFQKRKDDVTPVASLTKVASKKKVVWKDGFKTITNRNRKLLEEVFVFEKNAPATMGQIDEDETDSTFLGE
eukprot:scaffold1489_cov194-Cylindrotheca_fusiformis.AAC.2